MSFLGDNARTKGTATSGRKWIGLDAEAGFREKVLKASAAHGLAIYLSAAVLAFSALDREVQVATILAHRRKGKGDAWSNAVATAIYDKMSEWSFPLFRRCDALRAAVAIFLERPAEVQQEWVKEVYIFAGDPRNAGILPTPTEASA